MNSPLDSIAPSPRTRDEATAEAMWRHTAAHALLCHGVMLARLQGGRWPDSYEPVGSYSTAHLLRALIDHAPHVADEVARDLFDALADADAFGRSAAWLDEAGLNPAQIVREGRALARHDAAETGPTGDDRVRARLAEIARAHEKEITPGGMTSGDCRECGHAWPCPTYTWAATDRAPDSSWDPRDEEETP